MVSRLVEARKTPQSGRNNLFWMRFHSMAALDPADQRSLYLWTISPKKLEFIRMKPREDAISGDLDKIDLKILETVAEDGRISITDLAAAVGLSKTPCQLRLKRLVSEGYIDGFRAVINPQKMGLDHIAFAEVKLTNTSEDALRSFNEAVKKIREVEECHMIAGRFDYLLKVRTRDIGRYRRVLGELISTLPYVASTSTNVAMESVKESW
jgi:Lrp/AsnC family leucine-responsive transcriptional regulator